MICVKQRCEHDKNKIAALRRLLLRWFAQEARDLPWRQTRDPYAIWVSEIMLQQTRVEAVIPYFGRFLKAFPTVQGLAAASQDRVLKLWEGLGYYSRARNLHQAAKVIVNQRSGEFPRTLEAWRSLPGVGSYTAGALASIASGLATPAVDGNILRVFSRIFEVAESIDKTSTRTRIWELASVLLPRRRAGDFNQALMDLGSCVCIPRKPRCQACPVKAWCAAMVSGRQDELPIRKVKKSVPHQTIVVAVIRKNGRYLIGKRPAGGLLGGLWEFPGGKVEPGESHDQALVREVIEETDLEVRLGRKIAVVDHAYSHFTVTLHVYACEAVAGKAKACYHSDLKWVLRGRLKEYAFPTANRRFLGDLP